MTRSLMFKIHSKNISSVYLQKSNTKWKFFYRFKDLRRYCKLWIKRTSDFQDIFIGKNKLVLILSIWKRDRILYLRCSIWMNDYNIFLPFIGYFFTLKRSLKNSLFFKLNNKKMVKRQEYLFLTILISHWILKIENY